MRMKTRLKRTLKRNWHRDAIGGMWDEIGSLQTNFLRQQGLQPHHRLLDVGCGSLRGGVHLIAYLEPGHYYGIEKDADILERGQRVELRRYGLTNRQPQLYVTDDFDVSPFEPVTFDVMIAQSVFTHSESDTIECCLIRLMPYLAADGAFYATFFRGGEPTWDRPHHDRPGEVAHAYYPFWFLEGMAERLGIVVEDLGEWGHPRGQQMARFFHD